MKELRERQMDRELEQYQDGIVRARKESDGNAMGDQPAGMGLVAVSIVPMTIKVEELVAMLESGDAHPSQIPLGIHYMTGLNAEIACSIAARVCVSAAYVQGKLLRTAMRIANLIEEDYRFAELMQSDAAPLGAYMQRKTKEWNQSSKKRQIMRKAADIGGIQRFGWTEEEKAKLGTKLIEVFVSETGMAELVMQTEGKRTIKCLRMVPEVEQRIKDNLARIEGDRPVNRPMIFPPAKWTSPVSGGYLTQKMQQKSHLVRSIRTETRDDLMSSEMSEVYSAVNSVQATRWCINVPVLNLLNEVTKDNSSLGGLPQMDDEPVPAKPNWLTEKFGKGNMTDDQKAEFTEWVQRSRAVHDANAKLKSKRLALMTKQLIANELCDEEVIYFPHSLDFRGRVYSMTAELQPQGDDVAKSLIMFADGKPLGESGAFWLAVHIANLFGEDKQSFEDRVQWTLDNTDAIMDSAALPLNGARFWATAEDPWCALAACFEWTGFQIEGNDYMSHLPIAMDGSCSGIQHFSAMLRDAEGGAAVNLTNTDRPSDIYTEVLNVTKDLLAKNPDPLSKVWMDVVDRTMVKRPCMTFAYSVTSIGIRDQIATEMRKRCDGQFLPGHENWVAAKHLAPLVEQAIRQVVTRAAEAMDWLKEISKFFSEEEIPVMWTTPLGFPVVQPYRRKLGKVISLWFNGERIRLQLSYEGKKTDKRKHSLSIAPNFVHSLDATHLMMVVNRLVSDKTTTYFAMIHDSFGVHACDVERLHDAIRDEFIKLYTRDILKETYQSTLLALPGSKWPDVPLPPEAGDLNLEEVRDADFFFA